MNIEAFKKLPSIVENWGLVSDAVEELLTDHLIQTAKGSAGGEKAQAEVGAVKEIANLILLLRQGGGKPGSGAAMRPLKTLHRHEPKTTETTQKTTP